MSMEEVRWEAVFPGIEVTSSILQCKFPPFSAKSVHLSVNLPAMSYVGSSFFIPDYEAAIVLFEQALALLRRVEARFELAAALFLYGDRARMQGDLTRAERLYQESLAI